MSRKHRSLGRRWWTLVFVLISVAVGLGLVPGAASAAPACEDTFEPGVGPEVWTETERWSKKAIPTKEEVACVAAGLTVKVETGVEAAAVGKGSVEVTSGGGLVLASSAPGTDESSFEGLAVKTGGSVLSGGSITLVGASNSIQAGATASAVAVSIGGTLEVLGALNGETTVGESGTLTGTGTLTGAKVINEGVVAPSGPGVGNIVVVGPFEQKPSGRLVVQIKSTTEFDRLVVEGAVPALGGKAEITDEGGFRPTAGQQFEVVVAGSATGLLTPAGANGSLYESAFGKPNVLTVVSKPANEAPPEITGTLSPGSTLTCSEGRWAAGEAITPEYKWYLDGSPIGGQTQSTYVVQATDQGHVLSCSVTAATAEGTTPTSTSKGVAIPLPATEPTPPAPTPTPPANSAAPTISGILVVGQTIACQPGTWSSSPTGFAYQWYRDGVALLGSTASTYTVVAADQAHSLSCTVTASNGAGQSAAAKSEARVVPRLTPLPLACSKLVVQLLSIRRSGGSLVIAGVALARYVGQKVTIKAVTVPHGVSAPGGAATVTADGTFVTRVHAPAGPGSGRVRYAATLMGSNSPVLALNQPLQLVREGKTPTGVRLTLKGTGVLAKGKHKVTVMRRETCTKSATLLKVRLGRGGLMTVTLPLPEAGALAFYSIAVPVPGNRAYALAIAVPGVGG